MSDNHPYHSSDYPKPAGALIAINKIIDWIEIIIGISLNYIKIALNQGFRTFLQYHIWICYFMF
jgi:hypothetical protein